jgi:hypothetical protein
MLSNRRFVDILYVKLEAVIREFERPWKNNCDMFENNIPFLALSYHKAFEHFAAS